MMIGEVTEFTETTQEIQPLVCEGNECKERSSPGNSKTLNLQILSSFIAVVVLSILPRLCQIHI